MKKGSCSDKPNTAIENPTELQELVRRFLLAWQDLVDHQHSLIPQLAKTIGCETHEVFYWRNMLPYQVSSAEYRKIMDSVAFISDTPWRIFFHGLNQCDLTHTTDERVIPIYFGPQGCYDVFFGWSTLLYIMSSKAPWPDYTILKEYLADEPPPYNKLSGSHKKMNILSDWVFKLNLFEEAAPPLSKIKQQHTQLSENGSSFINVPVEYKNPLTKRFWDMQVCDVPVLSERGISLRDSRYSKSLFLKTWDEMIP